MAKYSKYIELRPGYESVVDLRSEERNPNLWQEYIVHEDMQLAVEKICSSFKMENPDQRRSFWIHGTYGTGKSYAAIVLKHLFTDSPQNIESFFDRKKLLTKYKNKFMSIRNKGDYLVVWKSGVTGISSGISLMMEMEMEIRKALKEKYHDQAYYGKTSLVSEAQRIVADNRYNWEAIFLDSHFFTKSYYDDFEEFRHDVLCGDLKACSIVADVCRENGWAMFASVDNFEAWIADIVAGNNLKDTGIIFVWDEFTDFVRTNGDDNVLQRLSEYCKKSPFYLFLIVHVDTSWVSSLGEDTYNRIMHRYHELAFHISENAALEMIGESIECKKGMEGTWEAICKDHVKSIIDQFDEMSIYNLKQSQLEQLCPLHPMTLTMLTRVADNFAASSRTLFSFMKDAEKAESSVGFIHYIENNGPDDWRWLTADYLWDYFFSEGSDIRNFSIEARRAYQLYEQKKDLVTGDGSDYVLRVFKAALLMIAVMSTDKVSYSNRRTTQKADATRNTIRKCFAGQLSESVVDDCLQSLYDSDILFPVQTSDKKDYRIELPYGQNVEKFDIRLEQVKKQNTRYMLFKKGGVFSKNIEDTMWSKNTDELFNRMALAACSEDTSSLSLRYEEVKSELEKAPYKLGLICVILSDTSHFVAVEQKVKTYLNDEDTGQMGFCIIKKALTDDNLDDWYRAKTHYELANEDGKEGSTSKYEEEMSTLLVTWSVEALDSTMSFYFADKVYQSVYGKDDLKKRIKKDMLFKLFEAAPEYIDELPTVYKKSQESFALNGVSLNGNKPNAQMTHIADSLKRAHVWDCKTIDELEMASGSPTANAVAALAKYIHSQMTQGAKIQLDELWAELQKPPFGYYNNMLCAYMLGFVFRFWKDSEFNWIDNESNPSVLTEKYLAKMVWTICSDKAINHTLSSGSEIWQSFKDYLKSVFDLKDNEVPNEQKARHSLCAKVTAYGVPLWALKYMPADLVGGEAAKAVCDEALDGFFLFTQNRPGDDQEEVMTSVVKAFTGKGRQRKNLQDALRKEDVRYDAFKRFVEQQSNGLKTIMMELKLNDNDLFDGIKKLMQANIETWTENQVKEKLGELEAEYKLVRALNDATGQREKTLKKHLVTLNNCFSNMKVPGEVVESMPYDWVDALTTMHSISENGWQNAEPEAKVQIIGIIENHGKEAWQNISSSKIILGDFIKSLGTECTGDDLTNVYSQISEWDYETSVPVFKEHIRRPLENIKNEKTKANLLKTWYDKSGFQTVEEWCKNYNVPIQWVARTESLAHIECVYKINNHKQVVPQDVYNALRYFETEDLAYLHDTKTIKQKFFDEIGEKYEEYFVEYGDALYTKIRVDCGSVVYEWANRSGRLIAIVEAYVKKMCEQRLKGKAVEQVKTINEGTLRNKVIELLDAHPELSEYFIH